MLGQRHVRRVVGGPLALEGDIRRGEEQPLLRLDRGDPQGKQRPEVAAQLLRGAEPPAESGHVVATWASSGVACRSVLV